MPEAKLVVKDGRYGHSLVRQLSKVHTSNRIWLAFRVPSRDAAVN
jgi:hypothetical protein